MEITKDSIENTIIYNEKYNIDGYWKYQDDKLYLIFDYDNNNFKILFEGIFKEDTYKWLIDIAEMMISKELDAYEFNKISITGKSLWD